MRRSNIFLIIAIAGVIVLIGAFFYYKNLRGIWPAISPPPKNIAEVIDQNQTPYPLKLPNGFSISVFAKDLPRARVMAIDGFGNLWVSQTGKGIISQIEVKDGKAVAVNPVFRDLNNPHGLVFDPQNFFLLYFAEENKISRVGVYSDGKVEKIADLPGGGGHFTRTLGFGPDNRLYVSIGSSCNVCNEQDNRRAKIFSMNKDGGDFKEFARGLRNAVFFTWSYVDGKMWATEMGRDLLGDNIPPDEINIIQEGGWYGWPWFYGKNIEDHSWTTGIPIYAFESIPSHIDLQAHSAPLGLAFVPEEGWPKGYWYNLFVSYHGSWNRSVPTGYKVVRIKLDSKGNYLGTEDFITGWLTSSGALGRPVDILVQPGGTMYISDDKAGVIYKVVYNGEI